MGRMLRVKNAEVHASDSRCGGVGKPVCCASACALMYLGGVHWGQGEHIGLHRPTLQDLSEMEFAAAQTALSKANDLVRQYLKEMGNDDSLYDAMMRAPPDGLFVYAMNRSYTPVLDDWLTAKCKKKGESDDLDSCKDSEYFELYAPDPEIDDVRKNLDWFSYASDKDLEQLAERPTLGDIRRALLDDERQQRDLRNNRSKYDAMTADNLKAYVRKNFDFAREDDLTSRYLFHRVEVLTGDRAVGSPLSDCIESRKPDVVLTQCAAFIAEHSSGETGIYEIYLRLGMFRRAEALLATGREDEAAVELDALIERVHGKRISFSPVPRDGSDVYAARAGLREKKGDWSGVIEDLTQALKGCSDSLKSADYLERRAAAYEQIGKPDLAAKDKASAMTNLEIAKIGTASRRPKVDDWDNRP